MIWVQNVKNYDFERLYNNTIEWLDTIDFIEYFKIYDYVSDIMTDVEIKYRNSDKLPEGLNGEPWQVMDQYDFGEYLHKRYNIGYDEEIKLKLWINR